MADIFNEIDEDLRRDQLKKLWDRYSTLILGLAFLIVAGVAGWRGWEYWRLQQSQAYGQQYYAAVKLSANGDHKGAEEAFRQLGAAGFSGYPVLAGLRAAGEMALAGDPAGAIKAYDDLARQTTTPPLLAGTARARAAYLALDIEDRAAVEARAKALTAANDPWRFSGREILALAAYKAGDMEAARREFEALTKEADVPRDFTARAEILMGLIRASASAKPAEKPAQ